MIEFDFGKLRQLRKQNHLTQNDAGKLVGCTGVMLSKMELGQARVSADALARFADAYGVDDMNTFFVESLKGTIRPESDDVE